MEIIRKDEFTWNVNGENLTTEQFVLKCCPSKAVVEFVKKGGLFNINNYSFEYADSPVYGWRHFFDLYYIKEDPTVIEEWDGKNHVLLY